MKERPILFSSGMVHPTLRKAAQAAGSPVSNLATNMLDDFAHASMCTWSPRGDGFDYRTQAIDRQRWPDPRENAIQMISMQGLLALLVEADLLLAVAVQPYSQAMLSSATKNSCYEFFIVHIPVFSVFPRIRNATRSHGWNVNPWVWVVEFRKTQR
jgi:hypothetical protein